jgi:hypothetical protein
MYEKTKEKKNEDGNTKNEVKENEISQNKTNHLEAVKAMNRIVAIRLRTEDKTENKYKLTRLYNAILI